MDSPQTHPSEETLSAYRDRELSPGERSRVEAHLSECPACRRVLRDYELLATALKSEPAEVPYRLDWELRARLGGRQGGRRFGFLPAAGSLAAAALLLIFATAIFNGTQPPATASAYPAPNATAVALTTAVEIAYPSGVDRGSVEASVAIDPPVQVSKEWRGDTLVLKPVEPLQPGTTYSVRAPAAPAQRTLPIPAIPAPAPQVERSATPGVVTVFTTAPVAIAASSPAPTALARPGPASGAPALAQAPSATAPAGTAEARPPVAAAAAATPSAAAMVASAADVTTRDLEAFLGRKETASLAMGTLNGPAKGVVLIQQQFEHGKMVVDEGGSLIWVVADGGKWSAFPATAVEKSDPVGTTQTTATPTPAGVATTSPTGTAVPPAAATAKRPVDSLAEVAVKGNFGRLYLAREDVRKLLGRAVASEKTGRGAISQLANAVAIATDKRSVLVLHADGRWREFAYVTPAPVPGRTATPAASPATGTATPTAAPTATPLAASQPAGGTWLEVATGKASCEFPVVRGFGAVYANDQVNDRLGCATAPEQALPLAEQAFEGGKMLWSGGTKPSIYILYADGTWTRQADTFVEGESLSAEIAPTGLLAPARGFGKVWRESVEMRKTLGWATAAERGLTGALQEFATGTMLWSSEREVFVLYDGGRWERFPDLFQE